jgi:hypothetical protein
MTDTHTRYIYTLGGEELPSVTSEGKFNLGILGLDSMMAAQIASRLHHAIGKDLSKRGYASSLSPRTAVSR